METGSRYLRFMYNDFTNNAFGVWYLNEQHFTILRIFLGLKSYFTVLNQNIYYAVSCNSRFDNVENIFQKEMKILPNYLKYYIDFELRRSQSCPIDLGNKAKTGKSRMLGLRQINTILVFLPIKYYKEGYLIDSTSPWRLQQLHWFQRVLV